MTAPQPNLLTPEELARRVGMSLKFIQKHTTTRRLPGMVQCGRCWRYDPVAVDKAILSGKILADAQ